MLKLLHNVIYIILVHIHTQNRTGRNQAGTRRNQTGWFVFYNDDAIAWESCKQDVVSLSTAEAELRSFVGCTKTDLPEMSLSTSGNSEKCLSTNGNREKPCHVRRSSSLASPSSLSL